MGRPALLCRYNTISKVNPIAAQNLLGTVGSMLQNSVGSLPGGVTSYLNTNCQPLLKGVTPTLVGYTQSLFGNTSFEQVG